MPFSRSLRIIFILFFTASMWAQEPATQRLDLPKPARDAQAITVLNQAIAVAGGLEVVAAVRDYRATGTVIRYEQTGEVQGAVTISGSGVAQFRLDENLPTGNRSESMDSGRSAVKRENGSVRSSRRPASFMPGNYALPPRQLVTLLKAKYLDVSYKGLVQVEGRPAHQIQAKFLRPRQIDPNGRQDGYFTKAFFIDASTFQVVMIEDTVPPRLHRKTRYSNYRPLNGMSVPFSIAEEIEGTQFRTIRLDNIGFNTGLQKSDFDLATP